jgi:peptidoglycan/LPS O-acetylase OafA/YrhL
MKDQPESRLQELDALRGIAALCVMLFHYTVHYSIDCPGAVPAEIRMPWGRYGVQLFFVISGFVIFLTLSRARTIADFAVNRFIRLYPAYWVCIAITFCVLLGMPLAGLNVPFSAAVANLTMLQYWLQQPFVDSAYWTLGVELVFYLMVSGLRVCGWIDKAERWIALWLLAIFAVRFALIQGMNLSPLIRTSLLLEHGQFFFAGVLFYRAKVLGFTVERVFLLGACAGAAYYLRDAAHGAALLVAELVFVAFLRGWLGWLCVRPLLWIGAISYPLYMLHQNIGMTILWRLQQHGYQSQVWILAPVAVSLLLAAAVHYWVELPSRDYLRGKWRAWKARPPTL